MADELKVNPYLEFYYVDEKKTKLILVSPKPGEGLQTLEIDRDSRPSLFELFTDLSTSSFNFLDVDHDVTDSERELLENRGVLVGSHSVPHNSLFECDLSAIKPVGHSIDRERLIVNSTLRFEPFDLSKFSQLAARHLSPSKARVWVRSNVVGIEHGYWLDNSESDIVSKFQPGQSTDCDIGDELLMRFVEAKILVPREQRSERACNDEIAIFREEFLARKYTVLEKLFPPEQTFAMSRYYRSYVEQGFMPFGDGQVEKRYRQHNEPFAAYIHPQLTNLISEIVGEPVKPSYAYAASYIEGAVLPPHIDREQCEYSISLQVDYLPEPTDGISPWPLFLEPFESGSKSVFRGDDNARTAVRLANGSGLLYKGRELVHYRDALPPGHRSTSLFFHYVSESFSGTLS
jgi:hypothetical protein